jgi:hypothetical protein
VLRLRGLSPIPRDLIGGKLVDNVSFHRVYNPVAQPERQFEEWLRCHHRAQALAAG